MKWLIGLLFIVSTTVNALTVDIVRKNDTETIKYINVLFLTATFGDYNCLGNIIAQSKFIDFFKIKSIDLNISDIRGSYNVEKYETLIKDKINKGNFDYIIIIDESNSFNDEFYETLKTEHPNKIITISHSANSDIRLFVDFNRFFLLLSELDLVDTYTVYYLHNKDNPIDTFYYNFLTASNNSFFKMKDVQICYIRNLTKLIDKVKNREDVVFISNMDFLYNEVSGKTIEQDEILELLSNYPILTLNISHNNCNHNALKSAFYLLWDYKELANIIDDVITQRRLENEGQVYVLTSKFNVNLSLNNILKSPDVKKLKSLLEFTDDVIIKK
jgi:hypothetical protein